ncbi:quinoprotein dehydrogenase-associated SoxYZ-like carrier [Novosphingobium sp. ERN07]|uniref:quinoprotein dehydrogenase-associated SoxYZ-like carrier n=1 Tax=Novosphingobium sp. ERN07 TaxID=2726187 RepID=UPI0014576127|nr:quinoprotein dehydrogenase-associated SoxYZ-like carrier [Novosphingobium sp. ERN07]NLR70141.1 quinoprotein dehydrogenase-associated SoxYZ-like carrier [Novosphingobium sp. ERN07]
MNRLRRLIVAVAVGWGLHALASYAEVPADPLGSPMWDHHAVGLFGKAPVSFDVRVNVRIPEIAENQRVFPVTVDARALKDAKRIVLLADLNPIPIAVDYTLHGAAPFLATRIKLDQRTPVRAAVQTSDGAWHVGGTWVDAAGGGCSAPPVSRVKGDWADHLGEVRGAAWPDIENDKVRLRMTFRHPMDTGLVENVPPYNIERLTVRDTAGKVLGEMDVFGSVAEDPAFTVVVDDHGGALTFVARDTAGLEFTGKAKP